MESELKPPLLIITYPRSASNLLLRMLSLPDQKHVVSVESGGYFFMPAIWKLREMGLLERSAAEWTATELASLKEIYTSCANNLTELLRESIKTGQRAIFKEHSPFSICPSVQDAYLRGSSRAIDLPKVDLSGWPSEFTSKTFHCLPPNDTVLPSDFLAYCVPSFLIRHPALAFPSYYRVTQSIQGQDVQVITPALAEVFTLRWTRHLYDWFLQVRKSTSGPLEPDPVIIDADDLLDDHALLLHYCETVGLDPSKAQFAWAPATKVELQSVPEVRLHTRSTLYASSGIVAGKTFRGMSIDTELERWKDEFGDHIAAQLYKLVMDAMPDYEYLSGRRMKSPVTHT